MNIPFGGRLTEKDLRVIQRRVLRRMMALIFGFFLLMFALTQITGGYQLLFRDPVAYVITWVPMALLVPLWLVALHWSSRRAWRQNKLVQQEISGSIGEEGIEWRSGEYVSLRVPWEMLLKQRTYPDMVLLFQGPQQVFVLRPHFFGTPEEWQAARELVARHLRK